MPLIKIPQEIPNVISLTYRQSYNKIFPTEKKVELEYSVQALLPKVKKEDIGEIDLERLIASFGRARKNQKGDVKGYSLNELKTYAKQHKIKVTGSKEDLVLEIRKFLISQGFEIAEFN